MKAIKSILLIMLMVALGSIFAISAGCGCDDDDDDDDDSSADDDDTAYYDDDDDTADDDDDDDDTGGDCEGLYDVILEGQTTFAKATSNWIAKLTINESGTMIGVIDPDDQEMDQYGVSGFRYDQTTGYLQGSFTTQESWTAQCEEETMSNYVDMIIIEGDMTGVVTLYCGEIDEENLLKTGTATGTVTCGDFAQ